MSLTYYARFLANAPRKRKPQWFEVTVKDGLVSTALVAVREYAKENNLKNASTGFIAPYETSETPFVDSDGVTQTIVMRGLFPKGPAVQFSLPANEWNSL